MIKSVLSGSFSFSEPAAVLVPRLRAGAVDRAWLHKRAAAGPLFDFDQIVPRSEETLIHLLALGDGEVVGCNRNGDWFGKAANQKYHPTFLEARFYRHHMNTDPEKSYGRVAAAAHNPRMGRVELVIGLDNGKCAEELELLEKDGEFPVSMSCVVPFDICSICGNKARSRAEYCKHASAMLGRILDDGRQVYVDNTEPHFFDISRVWRPADRVAWTFCPLRKAAADGDPVVGGAELAELLGTAGPPGEAVSIHAETKKAAWRRWQRLIGLRVTDGSAVQPSPVPPHLLQILKSAEDREALYHALHAAGICLPPEAFLAVIGWDKRAAVDPRELRECLEDLLCWSLVEQRPRIWGRGTYDGAARPLSSKTAAAVEELRRTHGLHPADANQRILRRAASGGGPLLRGLPKKRSAAVRPAAAAAAEEYGAYLLSFIDAVDRRMNPAAAQYVKNLTTLCLGG